MYILLILLSCIFSHFYFFLNYIIHHLLVIFITGLSVLQVKPVMNYIGFFPHLLLCRMTLEETSSETKAPPTQPISKPVIHPCVDPPLCEECQRLDLSFFDPVCSGCRQILSNPTTSVPEIFAILRQWTPQTQQSLELLVEEVQCGAWYFV